MRSPFLSLTSKGDRLFAAIIVCITFGTVSAALGAPTLSNVAPSPGAVSSLTNVTVTFSEPVINVVATDLLANGNPAADVTGSGATYTFVLERQPDYGAVQMSWDPSHGITGAGSQRFNENAPGSTWQYDLIDTTRPIVASLTPLGGATIRTLTQIEVLFSETVSGVDPSDLTINGAPATGLAVLGAGWYRFTFPSPAPGAVLVQWIAATGIQDFAPQPNNFSGGAWTYELDPNLSLPEIRINEFLASNIEGLADENGEAQDWIELWNYGGATVNLAGYALTDDSDDPGRWTFPATNLAPGQFLVVFASGKNRNPASVTNRFHTNFKLGAGGDYLGLFNGESPRVAVAEFAPEYPEQRNDHSYGYDLNGALKYFAQPTPGAANGEGAITRILPPPHFNVQRGYFESPFALVLSTPVYGADIHYTLDGSEPSATNGFIYNSPLTISNAAVVRAATRKENFLPSVTLTHTYLFLDHVLSQPTNPPGYPVGPTVMGGFPADYGMDPEIVTNAVYGPALKAALQALPSVSVAISVDAMFGPTNGIYTHVVESTTVNRGVAWERACSVEFLPNQANAGEPGFQVNCGIRMQGNASRNPQKTPKHPFRLLFKGDYGPGRLEYPLYPDSPVASFNTLVMRADFNNSWLHWSPDQRNRGTRIRDGWTKDTWRAMGQPGSHTRYFHLYINGLYWGIYDFGERIDAEFAASYLGGEGAEYDAMVSKPTEAIDGDRLAYDAMANAVRTRDLRILSNYVAVVQQLDIENFSDYMLLNFYGGNQDWGNDSNWNAVRRRAPGSKYKFISWDGEQLVVDVNQNRVSNPDVPAGLHTSLANSAEYRLTFADRAHKHLFNGGALSTNAVAQRWLSRAAQVDLPIIAESARWGDYRRDVHQYQNPPYILYTRNTGGTNWLAEINRLTTSYFPQRGNIFLQQLRVAGLYPSNAAPVFNQHGGLVLRGFNLTMAATNPVYFTLDGSDPRTFGTGVIAPTALPYTSPVTLSNSVLVKARALSGTNWSALNEALFTVDGLTTPLRITEIMYKPAGGEAYEFIELQNVAAAPLPIGGYSVDGIGDYVFAPDAVLFAGQIIVLGSDNSPANWSNRYPGITVYARFDGKLDNGGEKLAVKNGAGQVLWSVDYDDDNGWPTNADGSGYSIEIIDVFGDPDDPANWRASSNTNGSPGIRPALPPPVVVFNEVMADNISAVSNGGLYPDWIELHNPGLSPVNLSNWSLSDDSDPRAFVFPDGATIAASGYLVVWCDTNAAVSGLRAPFGLGRNGDSVFLFDANTNRVDAVGFGLQVSDLTLGRLDGGWTLTQPTPNAPNIAIALADPTNFVVNEWLANAVPGGDDWIELHNASTMPASLAGLHIGISNVTFQLTAHSFVPGGGFIQLLADENAGPDHVDFKLPAAGGDIVLYDAAGLEIQRVSYSPQLQGVSEGRLPDGQANIVGFPGSASPGASNYLLNYGGPFLNEVLAAATDRNTVAPRDFIELRNTNASPFDLSGMRLSNDPDDPLQWVFPSGTTIAGNGLLVVWFDNDVPASTTAGPALNTGQSLDAESGEVWLFNATGQPVDSFVFGFQITDMPLGRSAAGSWDLLTSPSPGAPNTAAAPLGTATTLHFNEWLASSPSGLDWFELYNSGPEPVLLSGLFLSDSPAVLALQQHEIAPFSLVAARGFVRFFADGSSANGRNHVNFSLNGDGETLRLYSPSLGIIQTVHFGLQATNVSEGRLLDGESNIVRFPLSATPAESNYLPIEHLAINELLSNPQVGAGQFIELHNLDSNPAPIGGWYLSDSPLNFQKFRIAAGTTIAASSYAIFEQVQFNGGVGSLVPFTFDPARNGEAWLSAVDGSGNLTGYRRQVKLGPAERGVSFVRHSTSSQEEHFVAAEALTTGAANAPARVGPVVINEIMYRPLDFAGGQDNIIEEFIELYNTTTNVVPLHDPAAATNTWRLRGGISFDFPPGVTINSRAYLLVVSFDPATDSSALIAFRSRYGIPVNIPVYGPYRGKLDNGGEEIEFLKPSTASDGPTLTHILVDRIDYDDAFPWPIESDGAGSSLQRRRPYTYGNDPGNWKGAAPTAGRANIGGSTYADFDKDGMPDAWESANGFNGASAVDANQDADSDGLTNYEEFLDGTDPRVAASRADSPVITAQPGSQSSLPGSNIVFSVAASGSPTLNYQWRFNERPIDAATTPTLSLLDIDVPHAGVYDVIIWNGAGFVLSEGAQLIVNHPPRIITHPQTQSVPTNTMVTFNVVAQGTGLLHYQWQRNGNDLLGATNASLVIPNAELSDEGFYRVRVTDDVTTITSAPARLMVQVRPVILIAPQGSTNVVGSSFTFSVLASGSVPMGFQWRGPGGVTFPWQVLDTTNSSLTLHNLRTNDTGDYRVIITNSSRAVVFSGAASLRVVAPPVIISQPVSRTVFEGTNVTLSLGLAGTAPFVYQWHRNGASVTGGTNAALVFNNVQVANSGSYHAIATNIAGAVTSAAAQLIVLAVPRLIDPVVGIDGNVGFTLRANTNRSYTVEVSGNLAQWSVLTNFTAADTLVPISDRVGASNRFYRARLNP